MRLVDGTYDVGKVYATVLDKRIRAITEGKVLEEQGAFRRKRSCIVQILTVRQLGEKVIRKNKTMRMVCVDLEKAFDRVDRELLWQALERYGVRWRLKEAVESLYLQRVRFSLLREEGLGWLHWHRGRSILASA